MCKYERERKWEAVEVKKEAECILFADEVMWKWESVWVSVCAPACVRERVCARMCVRESMCVSEWVSENGFPRTRLTTVMFAFTEAKFLSSIFSKRARKWRRSISRATRIVRLPSAKAIWVRIPCQWNQRGRLVGPNVAIYLTSWPYKDLRVT